PPFGGAKINFAQQGIERVSILGQGLKTTLEQAGETQASLYARIRSTVGTFNMVARPSSRRTGFGGSIHGDTIKKQLPGPRRDNGVLRLRLPISPRFAQLPRARVTDNGL